jgi:hypothetical protein
MQALVQSFANLVAAMACAAFGHFGMALKACPDGHQQARPIPVATAPVHPTAAPLAARQRRT